MSPLRRYAHAIAIGVLMSPVIAAAQAGLADDPALERIGVDEHLDAPLPLGVQLRDHTGRTVRLGDYFDGQRPVLLTFAYHSCPVLCSRILDAVTAGISGMPWTLGKEYRAITVSIDPNDSPEEASKKRQQVLDSYDRDGAQWDFLVGDQASIDRLTAAAGYRYFYDEQQGEYAHPSVVMLLTPNGRFARYLYGLSFNASDLRIGLLEASKGQSISTVEQVILYCYRYDPTAKGYVLMATRVMQVGGGLVALLLVLSLLLLWLRELRHKGVVERAPQPFSSASPTASPTVQEQAP